MIPRNGCVLEGIPVTETQELGILTEFLEIIVWSLQRSPSLLQNVNNSTHIDIRFIYSMRAQDCPMLISQTTISSKTYGPSNLAALCI